MSVTGTAYEETMRRGSHTSRAGTRVDDGRAVVLRSHPDSVDGMLAQLPHRSWP